MTAFQDLIDTAKEIVDELGQTITIRRNVLTPNPANAWLQPSENITDHQVKAAVLPPSVQSVQKYASMFEEDTRTFSSAQEAVVPAKGLAITPASGDTVIVGTTTFTVFAVETFAPDGPAIVHIVILIR